MEENQSATPQEQQPSNNQMQQNLPNATGVLVLGILSIVFFFCYFCAGVVGLTLGIIALVMAKKGYQTYLESPDSYSVSSFNNMKAGKICAIIGICLSSLWVFIIIIYVIFILVIAGGATSEILETFNEIY